MSTHRAPSSQLLAPSAAGHSLRAPGYREPPPPIDERIVVPETRAEILDGQLLWANPADPPHATQHFDLAYVLGAHVVPGYRGAVDMLTRTSKRNDFAPDASIFPAEPDSATGGRQLEELAFEVTSEQALAVPTRKARNLVKRGVRRVFAILVKQRRVMEWSVPTDNWSPLALDAVIADPCLVRPLSVAALLDAAEQDNEVARALLAKGNPVLAQHEESVRREGRREAVLAVCEVLGIVPSSAQQGHLRSLDGAGLDALLERIKMTRRWE
jgi:Putative restriction endonuclease